METPIINNKGRLILIPNPNIDNSWLENFKNTPLSFGKAKEVDTCNGKDLYTFYKSNTEPIPPIADNECFTVFVSIDNVEKIQKQFNDIFNKVYPLTPDECFKKSN